MEARAKFHIHMNKVVCHTLIIPTHIQATARSTSRNTGTRNTEHRNIPNTPKTRNTHVCSDSQWNIYASLGAWLFVVVKKIKQIVPIHGSYFHIISCPLSFFIFLLLLLFFFFFLDFALFLVFWEVFRVFWVFWNVPWCSGVPVSWCSVFQTSLGESLHNFWFV